MQEKRRWTRYKKQYVVKYALSDKAQVLYDVSQLFDISKGGMKFFSYENYAPGTRMILFMRFPFLYPTQTIVEGEVVGSQEVLLGKTYKIRVKFINISPANAVALDQMDIVNQKNPG